MLTGIKHAFLRKKKDICAVGLAGDGVIADIGFQSILKWTNSNLGFSERDRSWFVLEFSKHVQTE